jgi:hypothetical protein
MLVTEITIYRSHNISDCQFRFKEERKNNNGISRFSNQ